MSFVELTLLALGLCFDTFAVSIGGGIQVPNMALKQKLKVISVFGVFQAAFLFFGWITGSLFANIIKEWDHWIAFIILAYLGIKMIIESFSKKEEESDSNDFLKLKRLTLLAIATSIDAVAVGVSMAFIMLPTYKFIYAVIATGLVTSAVSYIGIKWGQILGKKIGKWAEFAGGVILLLIGIKIFVEHLFF